MKLLKGNLFMQLSNLNDRCMRKPVPRIKASLYQIHQLMNIKNDVRVVTVLSFFYPLFFFSFFYFTQFFAIPHAFFPRSGLISIKRLACCVFVLVR